jgi:LacI family transcriptional regulator
MQKAMISAGIDPQEYIEISVDEMSIHDGERAAEQILALPERPDGVFCINDQLAIGVLRGLARHRVPVPMAIAVVGYGDSPIAEISPITLTTVRQPMFEIGRTAVARLLSEVEEPAEAHRHSSTVFTPSLVIRESAPQASLRG